MSSENRQRNSLVVVAVIIVVMVLIACFGLYDYFYPRRKQEAQITVGPGSSQVAPIALPIVGRMNVDLTVNSSAPVDVYVLSRETRNDLDVVENEGKQAGKSGTAPSDLLASEQNVTAAKLNFKTEERKYFLVLLVNRGKEPAEVKLECSGR